MENVENIVKEHYSVGNLAARILDGLTASGADLENLSIEDLGVVDEFHIGGRKATEYAIAKMNLSGKEHVLDIGSGIGGTARTIATQTGCKVSGIDLTPEYVEVAETLTRLTRLEDKADFQAASALSMPFEDKTFDAAITIHVAMNIKDREALYREVARVCKPGAVFCVFDIMKVGKEPITFPMPWAQSAQSSHLVTREEMGELLKTAGFEIEEVEDRTEIAIEFFNQSQAAAEEGPQALGVHIIMGETAREKFKNVRHNIEDARIAPVLMIARRKA